MYNAHELRQFFYYQLYPVFKGIISSDDLSHLLLLQHSMLILGGFQLSPVPQDNIEKATSQLKLYSSGLLNRGIPCRFLSHYIIHLPEDVEKRKCGIEAISAFPFEIFMNIFRADSKPSCRANS